MDSVIQPLNNYGAVLFLRERSGKPTKKLRKVSKHGQMDNDTSEAERTYQEYSEELHDLWSSISFELGFVKTTNLHTITSNLRVYQTNTTSGKAVNRKRFLSLHAGEDCVTSQCWI